MTQAGRVALRARVRQLLSEPEPMKWRVDLGSYNLDLLPRREARDCLRAYGARLVEGIACCRRLAKYMAGCGCSTARCAVARRPVYLLKGEIGWVDDFIAQLTAPRNESR